MVNRDYRPRMGGAVSLRKHFNIRDAGFFLAFLRGIAFVIFGDQFVLAISLGALDSFVGLSKSIPDA